VKSWKVGAMVGVWVLGLSQLGLVYNLNMNMCYDI
jgi:hypothetical protein